MGRDHNDDKKRSLVMGKFKFMYQDDAEDLEGGDKFQLSVVQNKLLGPVKYFDKSGKDPDVLQIYGKEREEGEGFSDPDIKIPGVLDLFTVVWTNPFGDIFLDQDIKLFEFEDIQKYSSYNDGPKSKEFCRFYSSSSSKDLDGFDSSIFWSAGFLYKHFKTCGVEKWDLEMRDLVSHYKNWRDWAHEVHNIPNSDKKNKFSDNPYSGPASTSTNYSRERRNSGNNNITKSVLSSPPRRQRSIPTIAVSYNPLVAPPSFQPPVLAAPPPGQPITIPIPGPDGSLVQVQLVTLPTLVPPAVPATPSSSSRYKYVNPHHVKPSTSSSSSWTREVDDFLSRPKCRTSSGDSRSVTSSGSGSGNRTVTLIPLTGTFGRTDERMENITDSPPPVKVRKIDRAKILARIKEREQEDINQNIPKEEMTKKKTFKPRASIMPPSPGNKGLQQEVNELDFSPEAKVYRGEIMDWRGKFGFISSEGISGKIFVHSKDFVEGRELAELGVEAEFQVLHQDSSVVGAKAVNVRIFPKDINE